MTILPVASEAPAEEHHQLTYFDLDELTDGLRDRIRELPYRHELMLVPTRGGLVIGGIMSHKLGMRFVLAIPFEEQYPAGQTADSHVEPKMMWFPPREVIVGKRVLVLDDLRQRGCTLNCMQQAALLHDAKSVDIAVLLDKPHKCRVPHMKVICVRTTQFWEIFPYEEDGPLPKRIA